MNHPFKDGMNEIQAMIVSAERLHDLAKENFNKAPNTSHDLALKAQHLMKSLLDLQVIGKALAFDLMAKKESENEDAGT